MYTIALILHSWIRWFALITVFGVVLAAVRGKVEGGQSVADRWGVFAMMALDLQMLLGLLLYLVVSPNMAEIRAHFGEAMQNPQLRFWAVEHLTAMVVAVVGYILIQIGVSRLRATRVVPVHTVQSLKEDAKWTTRQGA